MVIPVGGAVDCILMDKGGVWVGTGCGGPLSGPPGEGVFASNGLAVGSQLDAVERGSGGDAAGRKGFEPGHRVSRPVRDSQGPHCGEADGGVTDDQGGEGRVEEEALTLVGEALGVGHAGKGCQIPTQKINM